MTELPASYTPGSRDEEPSPKLYVTVYCVEYVKESGSKKRTYVIEGPTKDIFDLLNIKPDSVPAKIVRFDPPNATRTELYRWAGTQWEKLDA